MAENVKQLHRSTRRRFARLTIGKPSIAVQAREGRTAAGENFAGHERGAKVAAVRWMGWRGGTIRGY